MLKKLNTMIVPLLIMGAVSSTALATEDSFSQFLKGKLVTSSITEGDMTVRVKDLRGNIFDVNAFGSDTGREFIEKCEEVLKKSGIGDRFSLIWKGQSINPDQTLTAAGIGADNVLRLVFIPTSTK